MLHKERRAWSRTLAAYQFLANHNCQLLQAGIKPSSEQVEDERLAAEMVASFRGEMPRFDGSFK